MLALSYEDGAHLLRRMAFGGAPDAINALPLKNRERAVDALQIEDGSLYPALYRLEEQGWIAAEWGSSDNNRQAKYYSLTRAGRKQLAEEEENWRRLSTAIMQVLETS